MIVVIVIVVLLIFLVYGDIVNRYKYFDEIIEYIPKGAKVLDFGAGKCELSKYIGTRNNITSIDIHKSCENAHVYDGYKLPYEDNSFDVVLVMFVLHHIPHNKEIIKELQRVARKRIIVVEDTPVSVYQRMISRAHYLFFKQSIHMIEHMKIPEEWCASLGGGCIIKKTQSRSIINTTPHYIIIKDLNGIRYR